MAKKKTQVQVQPQPNGERKAPPVFESRIGLIRAVVWANDHPELGRYYSVTISRSYRSSDGEWRAATSFYKKDLLVVAEVARQAFLWIAAQPNGVPADVPAIPPPEEPIEAIPL